MFGHGTGVKYVMDAAPGLPALAAHLQSAALLMASFHFDSSRQHCLHPTLHLRQWCLLEEAESKLQNGH